MIFSQVLLSHISILVFCISFWSFHFHIFLCFLSINFALQKLLEFKWKWLCGIFYVWVHELMIHSPLQFCRPGNLRCSALIGDQLDGLSVCLKSIFNEIGLITLNFCWRACHYGQCWFWGWYHVSNQPVMIPIHLDTLRH